MKIGERTGLLVLLSTASGSADGWSYFGLGHAFVANMTGNTVLLGVSVFHLKSDFLHPLLALCGYLAGTIFGTLISRRVDKGLLWSKATSWALLLEALLLVGAETTWVATGCRPTGRTEFTLLICVATAIGIQSGAMVQLGVPGVATTYITGTWTTLTNVLTRLVSRQPDVVRDEQRYGKRVALQAGVLTAYFLSAVLTGWAFRHAIPLVGAVPTIAVLLAAVYGALRN